MQHYNLYKTLELDPSASSELLVDELTQRLDSGLTSNPGGEEELRLAREILGDPTKRQMYDSRLKADSGMPMNVQSLRSLAAMASPAATAAPTAPEAPEAPEVSEPAVVPGSGEGDNTPEKSFDVKRWWPIAAVVAGVLVIALVVPQLVGAGLGSSGPEKLANEIAQLDEDDRADWMNQHAAAGRAALLENKLENTSIGSSDDAEYAAGESYDLKDLVAKKQDGDASENTDYLDRLYGLSGIKEARLVGINTEVKNKDVHATSVNTQLFLFARDGGDWKLYDIFD
ncbi:J domain-containing protein [Corynebacterium coyleae]|uniref:J domain-containing protein n=1 Tax=Corynebacterium coyleae TaxID=53374 RepID=UPI001CC9C00A|nr:J domain-containing protein [Corynebacterium coyleae]UBI08549.1 J domain-containing protein [Corynebacterium coyleae]